jgi:SPOR domain
MKILFLLLLVFNVALAAYIQLKSNSTVAMQLPSELHPEKIKQVSAFTTCLEWGTFIEPDLPRAETALAREQLSDKVHPQAAGKIPVFWVHIPPLASRTHAERKIGELERLGVTTHAHVQDDSKWNNAISMGFFQNIEDAQAFLAELRSKGVRSAIIGARNIERMKFVIIEPAQSVVDKMVELKQEFPHTELETLKCENLNN